MWWQPELWLLTNIVCVCLSVRLLNHVLACGGLSLSLSLYLSCVCLSILFFCGSAGPLAPAVSSSPCALLRTSSCKIPERLEEGSTPPGHGGRHKHIAQHGTHSFQSTVGTLPSKKTSTRLPTFPNQSSSVSNSLFAVELLIVHTIGTAYKSFAYAHCPPGVEATSTSRLYFPWSFS